MEHISYLKRKLIRTCVLFLKTFILSLTNISWPNLYRYYKTIGLIHPHTHTHKYTSLLSNICSKRKKFSFLWIKKKKRIFNVIFQYSILGNLDHKLEKPPPLSNGSPKVVFSNSQVKRVGKRWSKFTLCSGCHCSSEANSAEKRHAGCIFNLIETHNHGCVSW